MSLNFIFILQNNFLMFWIRCVYVCVNNSIYTSTQERELPNNNLVLTNKLINNKLALKKLMKFMMLSFKWRWFLTIIQISLLRRTHGEERNYFIWELGFMTHVFCFSEHPYRPIWEEGAAMGRIHADVFCASTPYHDPVTAGKEAAAGYLPSISPPFWSYLTGYV